MTDTERLDWLEQTRSLININANGQAHVCIGTRDYCEPHAHIYGADYRQAIDNAMLSILDAQLC